MESSYIPTFYDYLISYNSKKETIMLHPHVNMKGIDDQSLQVGRTEVVDVPKHCPIMMGWATKGDTRATFLNPKQFVKKHGSLAANGMKSHLFHPWMPYIEGALGLTQTILFKRLRPEDAKTAGLTFALDILETDVPLYAVGPDGHFIRDDDGDKVPDANRTVPGLKIRPRVVMLPESEFGVRQNVPGDMEENGVRSTVYMLHDLQHSSFGSEGNKTGVRFWTRRTDAVKPVDVSVISDQRCLLFGMEIVVRPEPGKSPVTVKTKHNERSVEFALKPDAYNPTYDQDLFIDTVLDQHYRDVNVPAGFIPDVGPFRDIHTYHDNVEQVLKLIQSKEIQVNPMAPSGPDDIYLYNPYAPHDENNVPYRSVIFEDSLTNRPEFTENHSHYLTGGDDGDTSIENWHALVEKELANFGKLADTYKDVLRYPFSNLYDPGFNRATKDAIAGVMMARDDVVNSVSTVIHGAPKPTASQEYSLAMSLRSGYRLIPESIDFSTQTCNVELFTQQARILPEYSTYKGEVPMTFEIMMKRCEYMGKNNGRYDPEFAYDSGKKKQIKFMDATTLSYTWLEDTTLNARWNVGINDPRTMDSHGRAFYPGIQTIYPFTSSILNNDINNMVLQDLKRVSYSVFVDLVGDSKLTKNRFIDKSNRLMEGKVEGVYDNRMLIIPETYFDDIDAKWGLRIHTGGNIARTANDVSIVAYRLEDLQNASINN